MLIHVNSHTIRSNQKHGRSEPAIAVRRTRSASPEYYHEVEILGPSKLVYRPERPLSCGARLWVETDAEVVCS
jgi:hypothetical protein